MGDVYVSTYLWQKYEEVHELVKITCMHVDVLHGLAIDQSKKFWLHACKVSHQKKHSFMHVQEICFVETNPRILLGYYFSRSRPPEIHAHVKRIQWWRLFSLKEIGWGPPRETCVIRVQVLFNNFYGRCLVVVCFSI